MNEIGIKAVILKTQGINDDRSAVLFTCKISVVENREKLQMNSNFSVAPE
jgi:hypothetical protein